MKKEIFLKPQNASLKLFNELEKRKLVRLMRPTKKTVETKTKTGAVSRFYNSSPKYGSHTLLCVGKRSVAIKMCFHEDNEDFLLLNPTGLKFKNLYLIISLLKKNDYLKKLNSGKISAADFIAVKTNFNDPETSFFTMIKNTVHCEITDDAHGQHPVFFISEPSCLKNNKINNKNYNIRLATEKK
jgi:hypothetical protein